MSVKPADAVGGIYSSPVHWGSRRPQFSVFTQRLELPFVSLHPAEGPCRHHVQEEKTLDCGLLSVMVTTIDSGYQSQHH